MGMAAWQALGTRSVVIGILLVCVLAATVDAQTFFYNEIIKDGRIYVFADGAKVRRLREEQRGASWFGQ